MFESPATSLDAVVDVWGDAFFVGGIDAQILTRGTPGDVRRHVAQVCNKTRECKGFALCCSGGLIGNMPLENLEAYFDSRVEFGYTKPDWRHSSLLARHDDTEPNAPTDADKPRR